mmetsp:Transcript_126284/g.306886  ORF Transcript_126284/g.306886 Transcript_126284/m.306886 type:complete len:273 (-) Transcript_126284:768-1586(-)
MLKLSIRLSMSSSTSIRRPSVRLAELSKSLDSAPPHFSVAHLSSPKAMAAEITPAKPLSIASSIPSLSQDPAKTARLATPKKVMPAIASGSVEMVKRCTPDEYHSLPMWILLFSVSSSESSPSPLNVFVTTAPSSETSMWSAFFSDVHVGATAAAPSSLDSLSISLPLDSSAPAFPAPPPRGNVLTADCAAAINSTHAWANGRRQILLPGSPASLDKRTPNAGNCSLTLVAADTILRLVTPSRTRRRRVTHSLRNGTDLPGAMTKPINAAII